MEMQLLQLMQIRLMVFMHLDLSKIMDKEIIRLQILQMVVRLILMHLLNFVRVILVVVVVIHLLVSLFIGDELWQAKSVLNHLVESQF